MNSPAVTLHDSHSPAVSPGKYTVKLSQKVGDNTVPDATQEVVVAGPGYTLDPTVVFAVYPPAGGKGDYSTTLPHITLRSVVLPWARKTDEPWLALLLVQNDDVVADPSGAVLVSRPLKDLGSGSSVWVPPVDASESGGTCMTVDLTRNAVEALLPRRSELRYLTHVRDVSAFAPSADDNKNEHWETGKYSVLVSSRLATTEKTAPSQYTALLVSLASHPLDDKGTFPAQYTSARFIVLHSWAFESVRDQETGSGTFGDLASQVQTGPLALPAVDTSGAGGSVGQDVKDRVSSGYVPIVHQLPTGERDLAWYRGPFTPYPPRDPHGSSGTAGSGFKAWASADAAMVYLPAYGVFDVSYAAAYELGRSLAWQNADLTASLARFRAHAARRAQAQTASAYRAPAQPQAPGGTDVLPTAPEARSRFEELLKKLDTRQLTTDLKNLKGDPPQSASAPSTGSGAARGRPHLPYFLAAPVIADPAPAAELADSGLDRNALLVQVPWWYLVPDAGMLPPDSARLFHVDSYWVDALVSGAASVGASTSFDVQATQQLLQAYAAEPAALPSAGMLLRSSLVLHWPKLDVTATGKQDVRIMTVRKVAADILLVLFSDLPEEITITEPEHALQFGIDGAIDDSKHGQIGVRDSAGNAIGTLEDIAGTLRPGSPKWHVISFDPTSSNSLTKKLQNMDLSADVKEKMGYSQAAPAAMAYILMNQPQKFTWKKKAS
ncbi:hypothetical protein LKL35_36915 [Streptomyces sp. ET3-23]|uniref:hypothetical protein n=1 Tax=Streptomyces sp. ET3-23 TaxID=2885643 RepID=UPI001D114484|nr:hypothetical protein [Streptomyces sp. ET3-23]MCC2280906.1 hypothetical protein [Streptomyces sp. ET3-23]